MQYNELHNRTSEPSQKLQLALLLLSDEDITDFISYKLCEYGFNYKQTRNGKRVCIRLNPYSLAMLLYKIHMLIDATNDYTLIQLSNEIDNGVSLIAKEKGILNEYSAVAQIISGVVSLLGSVAPFIVGEVNKEKQKRQRELDELRSNRKSLDKITKYDLVVRQEALRRQRLIEEANRKRMLAVWGTIGVIGAVMLAGLFIISHKS